MSQETKSFGMIPDNMMTLGVFVCLIVVETFTSP